MTILHEIHEAWYGSTLYGHYVAGNCPFHDDSSPSMRAYVDLYYCEGCGKAGTTVSLLEMLKSGRVISKTKPKPTKRNPFTGWIREDLTLGNSLMRSYNFLKSHWEYGRYWEQRGFSREDHQTLKIGYRDQFLTLPIVENDKIEGAVARFCGKTKYRFFVPNGQEPNLLYVPGGSLTNSDFLFLTFGIFDAISIWKLGFPAASTTTGKRIDSTVLSEMRKRVIVIPDMWEEKEAYKLAYQIGFGSKVFRFPYPLGTKDINDVYLSSKDFLQEKLNNEIG